MAVYQFVVELLSNEWVEKNKEFAIKLLSNGDEYDTSISWENYDLKMPLDALISKILPVGKSWHKDLKVWGEHEHNDIQVWLDQGRFESIKIRLDLRDSDNFDALKLSFVELANQLNCSFLDLDKKLIFKADIKNLNIAISNSRAKKFVSDSRKFLDDNNI